MSATPENIFYNVNIERAILSTILYEPQNYEEIALGLRSEHFYHPFHKALYQTIQEINGKYPIDEEFIRQKYKGVEFDNDSFFEVLSTTPLPNTIPYKEELAELYTKREMLTALNEAKKALLGGKSINQVKEAIASEIDRDGVHKKHKTLGEWYDYYETQPPMAKFDTGVSIIDQGLDGLEAGQLILIGGDPEAGKTVLGVQILKTIIKHSPAVFYSLEFTIRHFIRKQVSIHGKEYVQNQHNLIVINDEDSISDIADSIRMYAKQGYKFVLIDSQMRLVSDSGRTVEEEETRKFSVLAKLAHRLEIVIILIFQTAKGQEKSPMGSKKAAHESSVTFYLSFPPEHVKRHEKDGFEYRFFEVTKNKQNGKRFKELVKLNLKNQTFSMLQKETQKKLLDPKTEPFTADTDDATYKEVVMADDIEFSHIKL